MTLLSVEGLRKSFGPVPVIRGVSFTVAVGELVAVIGPNGAGKSTLFNMIGGQLPPDGGEMMLEDALLRGLSPREIWRRGVARTFQVARTFSSMSVIENVQIALISLNGESKALFSDAATRFRAEAEQYLMAVGMAADAERAVSELSYGDVKRVEMAIALASRPRLLLMDEPTAGMAAAEREAMMRLVHGLARERGMGVLFTEHDIAAVFGHADRVLVLVEGAIVAAGPPDEIRRDPEVKRLYLGSGVS